MLRFLAAVMLSCWCLISQQAPDPIDVSLIEVIANPQRFNGQYMRVEGYIHCKFEDYVLYLSKDDGDFLIGKNGVWIEFSPSVVMQPSTGRQRKKRSVTDFDCRYVLVEGIFDMQEHGHLGANSGTLKNVTRILELERSFDGKRQLVY